MATPGNYAAGKANLFSTEGGPAIVEIEVPGDIAALATDAGGGMRFEAGFGLAELLKNWLTINKRVL
jgi:hypothetical protein